MNPIDLIRDRLGVSKSSQKFSVKCPAHEDSSPSLSVKALDDGRVLIHCFAGCSAPDVLAAIGLTLSDLYPKGALGELSGKPHRRPENNLYQSGYDMMQEEIFKLRARVSAK